MSGRRRYPRYVMSNTVGLLRVLIDVTVHQDARGHLIAISDQPRRCGEVLKVEAAGSPTALCRSMRVAEVGPIVLDGSIRHCSRLVPLEMEGGSTTDSPAAPSQDVQVR